MPSTGGSPWQYVNEAHYFSALEITERCVGFAEIARSVHKAGGIVCIEWPTQCNSWRGPQVKYFVRELEFVKTALHYVRMG
eukprot:1654047-Pyramimonas_sp.AAC.1